MKYLFSLLVIALVAFPAIASAHCPLCTAGAGVLAIVAARVGVATSVVGILIGAFAVALALWIAPMLKRRFISYQREVLALIIYLGTIIPIAPLIREYAPLYISIGGEYGTLLHNTYTINLFLAGVLVGTFIMIISPKLSRALTRWRGAGIAYQGLGITFGLLIGTSLIAQFLL